MAGISNGMMQLLGFKKQYCTVLHGRKEVKEFILDLTDAQIPQVYTDFILVYHFQNVIMNVIGINGPCHANIPSKNCLSQENKHMSFIE